MYHFIETIHAENFQTFLFEQHLQRIQMTIREYYGLYKNLSTLKTEINQITSSIENKTKISIHYNDKNHQIIKQRYQSKKITRFFIIEKNDLDYHLKYADRTPFEQLKKQLLPDEEIIITQNGNLTDTTFSNICLYKKGIWYTPNTPLFNGIKRQFLLSQNLIQQINITTENLNQFEKLCLINSMLDLQGTEYDLNRISF